MSTPEVITKAAAKPAGAAILAFALKVCEEYHERGYAITIRQLYYQGVARKFWPSGQDMYDKLVIVVSEARKAGTFPLWALVDRTRHVQVGQGTRCDTKIDRALQRAADEAVSAPDRLLHRDMWFGQPVHVSVWFEKEALAGIFEAVCVELGVSWFSCRGDPSHPALYQWMRQAAAAHGVDNLEGWKDKTGNHHKGMAKRSVILYFGDLDPTGIRIPRSAEETLRTFMRLSNLALDVEFVRVGITQEMARALNLPPFPAKESAGADYSRYVEEEGTTDAWELDAIPPELLEDEVRKAVRPYLDVALYKKLQDDMAAKRAEMRRLMKTSQWHRAATRNPED